MPPEVAGIATSVVTSLIIAGLSVFAGWAWRALRDAHSGEAQWKRAMGDGMRSLLRCELIRSHREFVVHGAPMARDDREYIERTYAAYHDLGGNGSGTRLFEELMEVGIKEG